MAADTVAVAAAKREARTDSIVLARAVVRAQPHEAAAKRSADQADSPARMEDWEDAYEARSREVSELLSVDALRDTALVAAEHGGTALSAALPLTEVRASEADTLLTESVRLNRRDSGCGFRCRARGVIGVGVVVGAVLLSRRL